MKSCGAISPFDTPYSYQPQHLLIALGELNKAAGGSTRSMNRTLTVDVNKRQEMEGKKRVADHNGTHGEDEFIWVPRIEQKGILPS